MNLVYTSRVFQHLGDSEQSNFIIYDMYTFENNILEEEHICIHLRIINSEKIFVPSMLKTFQEQNI